jgi:hypothetical protein
MLAIIYIILLIPFSKLTFDIVYISTLKYTICYKKITIKGTNVPCKIYNFIPYEHPP